MLGGYSQKQVDAMLDRLDAAHQATVARKDAELLTLRAMVQASADEVRRLSADLLTQLGLVRAAESEVRHLTAELISKPDQPLPPDDFLPPVVRAELSRYCMGRSGIVIRAAHAKTYRRWQEMLDRNGGKVDEDAAKFLASEIASGDGHAADSMNLGAF